MSKATCNKLDTFQNRCLFRILNIFWPKVISNDELYRTPSTYNIRSETKRTRWRWIGHVLRMEQSANTRVASLWTPLWKRARERPRETWRRTEEKEIMARGFSWGRGLQKKRKTGSSGGLLWWPYVPKGTKRTECVSEWVSEHMRHNIVVFERFSFSWMMAYSLLFWQKLAVEQTIYK